MRLSIRRSMLPVVGVVAVGLFSVPPAMAQTPSTETPPPQAQSPAPVPSQPSKSIPEQKLDATAAALERVANLKQDYQQQIATAAPSDKPRIADEATTALTKAVTDQGLSVDEYTTILELAQNDPDIRDKILARIHPATK
jgi:curli biogenesis system outer membrane secretion channel CsgG